MESVNPEHCNSTQHKITNRGQDDLLVQGGNRQPLSQTAPFSRPAITTGAALPWRGKQHPSLGPPRAIQSTTTLFPTITVASSGNQYGAKVTMTQLPPSPFSWSDKREDWRPQPSVKVEEDSVEDSNDAVELEAQPKQSSVHSNASSHSQEPRLQSAPNPGQTITTAQNVQRGTQLSPGIPEPAWPYGSNKTAISNTEMRRGGVTVTTSGLPGLHSFPMRNTAVTTGQAGRPVAYASDGGLDDLVAPKREGLRSASKRRAEPVVPFELDSKDSSEEAVVNSEVELGLCSLQEDERRRVRRRMNNLRSARRVREKRDEDLREVHFKVTKLEEEQAKLVGHCEKLETTCHKLRLELQELQQRWSATSAENKRLQHELNYLRRNNGFSMDAKASTHMDVEKNASANMPTEAEIAADLALDESAFIKGRASSQVWTMW